MDENRFDLNFFKKIYAQLSPCATAVFVNEADSIELSSCEDINKTASNLKELGLEIELIRDDLIRIPIYSNFGAATVFWNDDCFKEDVELSNFEHDIFIFNRDQDTPRFYSALEQRVYMKFKEEGSYFFSNAHYYLKLLEFLKQVEKESNDEIFSFVDYFNTDSRKILFTSLHDKGRLIIPFGIKIPSFDEQRDFSGPIIKFFSCFDDRNKHLPKFLKSEFFNFLSKEPQQKRMGILIKSLSEIIEAAEINFEVYLNELSIDQLRKDYDDYKEKYFSQLSELLNKVTNKIFALPVAFSATLFAVINIKDSTIGLIVIGASIIAATAYIASIIKVHFEDINYIESTFKPDYQMLEKSPFFIKYPGELTAFERVKNRIEKRIQFLRRIMEAYFWILFIFNAVILLFIVHYFSGHFLSMLFGVFILIFVAVGSRNAIVIPPDEL